MKKRKRLKPWIIIVFIIICLGISGYSFIKIIKWKKDIDSNNKIKEIMIESVIIKDKDTDNKEIKYEVDFSKLKETNNDTIAYLKVNGTNIDYVVVKGSDNDYYLNHNFNKNYNVAGWVFADYRNRFDGTDKNIIIYGHNMMDGSMFGTLHNIFESSWLENKENLQIVFITEEKEYKYEVFSTYMIKPEAYYINTYFNNEEEYYTFLKTISGRSYHNYNINLSKEDKILTLSSCSGDGSKRIVLHAKMINE